MLQDWVMMYSTSHKGRLLDSSRSTAGNLPYGDLVAELVFSGREILITSLMEGGGLDDLQVVAELGYSPAECQVG